MKVRIKKKRKKGEKGNKFKTNNDVSRMKQDEKEEKDEERGRARGGKRLQTEGQMNKASYRDASKQG